MTTLGGGDSSKLWSMRVKETPFVAETDLERRVSKLNPFYTLKDKGSGKDD
jgi:hypothetical protein